MGKVTDPELLALLNANDGRVTNPAVLAQLNGSQGPTLASEATAVGASGVKGVANLLGLPGDILKGARWIADQAAQAPGRVYNRVAGDGSWNMPAGLAGQAAETDQRLSAGNPFGTGMTLPGGSDIVRGIEKVTGELPKPQTMAGQYAGTFVEFAPAALLSPGTALQRGAMAAVPAFTSETAGQLTKGTAAEPYARLGGALAGGVATAWAQAPSYANRMTARAAQDVTPQQFQAAETLMRDAQARGVTLTVDEAIQAVTNGATRLGDVRRVVESTTEGGQRFAPVMAQRPEQMRQATDAAMNTIAPRSATPSFLGAEIQEAGKATLDRVRQSINKLAEPYYQASATTRIPPREFQQLRALPGYDDALAAVRRDPQLNRYVANLPDDSVGVLNEVKKQLDNAAQNAVSFANPTRNAQVSAGLGSDARAVNNMGRSLDQNYGQALDIEAAARQRALAPLEAGPVGQVTATDDFVTQGRALMGDRPSPQEVQRATANLMAENPQATRGLVREHIGRVYDKTVAGIKGPDTDQFSGAALARAIRGNEREAQNISAAIRAAAGPNAEREVSRLVDVLQATGWRQRKGSMTAFNKESLDDLSRGGPETVGNLAKPLQSTKDALKRARLGSQAERLAEILLSGPDGVRRVEQIATQGTGARAALAKALLTYSAASP